MNSPSQPVPTRPRAAFTLVEILVVVVILGILAAIVVVSISDMSRDAAQVAFISDLRSFRNSTELYINQTGVLPIDTSSGAYPTGMEGFIDPGVWTMPTPIGGVWDMENNDNGVTFALGVHFDGTDPTQDDAFMTNIDRQIDDGDLTASGFRKLAAERYYMVMAE